MWIYSLVRILTPVNSKLEFKCRKLKRDCEIEKCYIINRIVQIAKKKKKKIMKIYDSKDLQELFSEYMFDNYDNAG